DPAARYFAQGARGKDFLWAGDRRGVVARPAIPETAVTRPSQPAAVPRGRTPSLGVGDGARSQPQHGAGPVAAVSHTSVSVVQGKWRLRHAPHYHGRPARPKKNRTVWPGWGRTLPRYGSAAARDPAASAGPVQ